MDVSAARRLKALEDENARLKKLQAEQMLDNAILKDVGEKKWCRPMRSGRRWFKRGAAVTKGARVARMISCRNPVRVFLLWQSAKTQQLQADWLQGGQPPLGFERSLGCRKSVSCTFGPTGAGGTFPRRPNRIRAWPLHSLIDCSRGKTIALGSGNFLHRRRVLCVTG
jgi:hypothetical protein